MCGPHAGDGADELRGEVGGHVPPGDAALGRIGEGHGRIEVRARNRPEGQDQRDERGARGDGVGEQRDGDVPAGEPLAHDAGPDHGRQEQRRADGL